MLYIYNEFTRRKEIFAPLETGRVKLYVCGMTVYDLCHLGHARVLVVFDMAYRYLQALGYDTQYVRNITDIDDKIIARANEQGIPFYELTERFITEMHRDADALGVLRPDIEPKATEHIDAIIRMIQRLIDKGHAYVADNHDLYYAVRSFPTYGRLSGKSIDELAAGARIEPGDAKRDPLDFVLWKAAKPGEPSWNSPWGAGRPGWHIECSAMSTEALGDSFDIHGGGADLTFPHHENEIAQSEGASGHPFVKYWMHNGFVRINDEKMSKSRGNFFTVREILGRYAAEEIRYFILTSHYRSPLNYDEEHLLNARAALTRFYTTLRDLPSVPEDEAVPTDHAAVKSFHAAMQDDFNTPEALASLFDLAREINRLRTTEPKRAAFLGTELKTLGGLLGLLQSSPDVYLQGRDTTGMSDVDIENLINARLVARAEKDWQEADRIRGLLTEQGILLEDYADGTRWRRDRKAG